MTIKSSLYHVLSAAFIFLGAGAAAAAGPRTIHVPGGIPTLEMAATVATADDTVIVTDPSLRGKAALYEGLFRILFLPAAVPEAGAGEPAGPSRAPCPAEWIEGTVADAGGTPLAGISVTAWPVMGGTVHSATTDGAGQYILCADPGGYGVIFNLSGTGPYLPEVYDNMAFGCGDTVTVRPAQNVTVNAGLARGGAISGTVTAGGAPLAGAGVTATGAGTRVGTVTDGAGNYTLQGLRGGSYIVRFTDAVRAWEFYNDRGSVADAHPVTVVEGRTTTGVDASLSPGATLSGTVDDGFLPLPSALVQAVNREGEYFGSAYTDAAGEYIISGLRQGEYAVSCVPTSGQKGWYDGKMTETAADRVTVTPSQPVTGVDFSVKPAGDVQGVVADGGVGVPGVYVSVFDGRGVVVSSTITAADGSYTASNLMDGPHRVQANGRLAGYESVWYGGTADPAAALVVTIAGGSSATGVDFDVSPAATGSMSGSISFEGGQCSGIFGPGIMILPATPLSTHESPVHIFAATRNWHVRDLTAGNYRVRVGNNGGHHQGRWYPGVPEISRSRVVTVPPGADRGGVDVKLPRSNRLPVPEVSFGTPSYFGDFHFGEVFTMGPGERHPVFLDLACNRARGVPADYWFLARTPLPPPNNIFHFEPGRGWRPGLAVSGQGPCVNLDEKKIMSVPYFPVDGDVDFFFGLDGIMNGMLDPAALVYDGMRVHMYK